MANEYDKIIKENLKGLVLPLVAKTLNLELSFSSLLPSNLSYTIGRKADALMKVKGKNNEEMILHVEFQSTNDGEMQNRMLQYFAMLKVIYKLPVLQIVFYLGNSRLKMKNEIINFESNYYYNLINIKEIPYMRLLNSSNAEEVIFSILAGKGNEKEEEVIKKIFSKLQELLKESDLLLIQKIRQLEVLSILRNSRDLIIKEEQNMPLVIDITKDKLYKQGERIGAERGEKKGIEKVVKTMLMEGIDIKLIQKISKLSLNEIEKIKNSLK